MSKTGRKKVQVVSLFAIFFSCVAEAHKTSAVLPKGIFRARVVSVFGDPVVNKFNPTGERQELLAPLEQKVSTAQLASANADLKTLYDSLNSFEPNLGDDLYSAQLLADAKINFHQTTTALEYGLTSTISLGIIIPFYQVYGHSAFDARVSSNSAAVKQKVKGTMLEDGVKQFESQMPNRDALAANIFTAKGYDVPSDFQYVGLGDIEVGALFQTYKNETITSGIQAGFRLPTSTHKKNYANLLDQGTGDEQLDFGVEAGFDAQVTKRLQAGFHSRYTIQFANDAEMPVNKAGETGLPNLKDPSSFIIVNRNLGDLLENEAFLDYTINESWSPYVAYTYSLWGSDQYKGPKGYNYAALEENTGGSAHTIMVGMTISTINSYISKKMPVPLKFDCSYNKILSAKNKTDTSYGRLDLIVFF